jgi:hypothetical protein
MFMELFPFFHRLNPVMDKNQAALHAAKTKQKEYYKHA